MVKVRVDVTGLKETLDAFDKFGAVGASNARKVTANTAHSVANTAKRSIQQHQSSGRTYPRGKDGFHTASAPGNPPNSDEGALVREIRAIIDGTRARVGTPLDYGYWLEFGTEDMAARPWLHPAWQQHEQEYIDGLKTGLELAARGLPLVYKR